MITGMVTIYSVAIAHSEEPVVTNLGEISTDEVGVLIGL